MDPSLLDRLLDFGRSLAKAIAPLASIVIAVTLSALVMMGAILGLHLIVEFLDALLPPP